LSETIRSIEERVIACRRCPRLVQWREKVAADKVRRFRDQEYWARPVPALGDPAAALIVVGLAPAAHGGNRTGRVFTGDESGNWLFRALHKAGFANQPLSVHRDDGLRLTDCYITATIHCAPPGNKPLPEEVANCRPYLLHELKLLKNVRVVVGLGKIGFDAALDAYREVGMITFKARPKFAHAASYTFGNLTFIGTFHPSQQNTFTGKLNEPMLDAVFEEARRALSS